MRPYLLLILIPVLFLTSALTFAQGKEEKPFTKLPTIVVKGEDRSYLQITRPKRVHYMPYRGKKRKGRIPYQFKLPARERFKIELPAPAPTEVKLFPVVERVKKIPASPLPPLPLSEDYVAAERLTFPQVRGKIKFLAPEKAVGKGLIHPPLHPPALVKEAYLPPTGPSIPAEVAKIVKAPQMGKIKVLKLPFFTLSRRYIQEGRVSLVGQGRPGKVAIPRGTLGKKEVAFFTPFIEAPEKPAVWTPSPEISLKPPSLTPFFYEKEISPRPLQQIPLRQLYIEASLKVPEKKRESLTIKEELAKEEKRLIRPPLMAPYIERTSFPEKIKKSQYPSMVFFLGADNTGSFNYQLDYARERQNKRYILTLKRKCFPKYIDYQATPATGETLSREMDLVQGGISWGEVNKDKTQIFLQGRRKSLTLPEGGKRKDSSIYLLGNTVIFNRWKIGVWGEKSTREDTFPDEKYDNLSYGANLVLQPQKSDFLIKSRLNWDSLRRLSSPQDTKNRYQALLQIESSRPFSVGKNLFLESTRIGIKGVKNQRAQLVGNSKLHLYGKENWGASVSVNKKFHLPPFAGTYIPQDYSQVNLNLDAVNMVRYALETNYSKPSLMDISLEFFREKGDDVVWVYSDTTEPRLSPQTVNLSREGLTIKGNWHVTPSVIIEPSYTWKNVKNEEQADKVISHQPESYLRLLLTIQILKKDASALTLEAEGEWLSERYYTLSPDNILDSSSRMELKLIYRKENWETFLGVEKNKHPLSKNYKPIENKLKFGIQTELF